MTSRGSDRCPGALSPHAAADGLLVRLRPPGGRLTAARLAALADVAAEHDTVSVTARGNIQIRGLAATEVESYRPRWEDVGLAHPTHDAVRNIVASPGVADAAVAHLDAAICANHQLANLPGRFLIAIDDGTGDSLVVAPDLTWVSRTSTGDGDARGDVLICADQAVTVGRVAEAADDPAADPAANNPAADPAASDPAADPAASDPAAGDPTADAAIGAVVQVATRFVAHRRDDWWRISEMPADLRHELLRGTGTPAAPPHYSASTIQVGWNDVAPDRVTLVGGLVLGELRATVLRVLSAAAEATAAQRDPALAPVVITPDRRVVLRDYPEAAAEALIRVLAPLGVIFDANSPWLHASACSGLPGCAKSHADVRADLGMAVARGELGTTREHWVGCERACGQPHDTHVLVTAQPDGEYRRHP